MHSSSDSEDEVPVSDPDDMTEGIAEFKTVRNYIDANIEAPNLFQTLPGTSKNPNPDYKTLSGNISNFYKLSSKLSSPSFSNTITLKLLNCSFTTYNDEVLPPISTLKEIIFDNCSEDFIKVFVNQNSLNKITIIVDQSHEFPQKEFSKLCNNCKELDHLVLLGAKTGSFFNSDDFSFQISKLETTMITFDWFVGLKNSRIEFLKSQKESLKDLIIHELPYDFDGGDVLNYIIQEMKLENLYYGKIALILGGIKQDVKELEASELHITSTSEMIRQYPSIKKFNLMLSSTDISSENIEKIINPPTDIFRYIDEFEVNDTTSYYGIFGVFLGLYKNLVNIHKLTLRTQNKFLKQILQELPLMPFLKEIILFLPTEEIFETIEKFAPNLKIIKVADNNVEEARDYFGNRVAIVGIGNANAPGGANVQQGNEGANLRGNRGGGGGGGGGDDPDDDPYEGFPPSSVNLGRIVKRTQAPPVQTTFQDQGFDQRISLYKIHAFGYFLNILNHPNIDQLRELLEEVYDLVLMMRNEEGKMFVQLRQNNNTEENLNRLKAKLRELAYVQINKTAQLPLIILLTNERIRVYCDIIVNDIQELTNNQIWDRFIRLISDEVNASRWTCHDIEDILVATQNGRRITFDIDALSYVKIQAPQTRLMYNGNPVMIRDVNNPFADDMNNLSRLAA